MHSDRTRIRTVRPLSSTLSTILLCSALFPSGAEAQAPSIVLKDGGLEFPDGSIQNSANQPALNEVRVGVAGGDFQSIQDAVNHLSLVASASNPILVSIGPGVFAENVTLVPHVHLAGAGQGVSIVSASGNAVTMAANTSVRDLTVRSESPASSAAGILVPSGATGVSLFRVTAVSEGTPDSNGIQIDGGEAAIADSTGLSLSAGLSGSSGCEVKNGGAGVFRTSRCEGRDTNSAAGLVVTGGTVDLEGVELLGRGDGTSGSKHGLIVQTSATVTVRGGTITGQGGDIARGVFTQGESLVDLMGTRVQGTGGDSTNRGFQNNGSTLRARDCHVSGATHSVLHVTTGSTLVAESQLQGPVDNFGSGTLDCWNNYQIGINVSMEPQYQSVSCP